MALTMQALKALVEGEKLAYFMDPHRPVLMLGVTGAFGSFQLVILLDLDGTFLQFRTIHYLACPAGSKQVGAVLKLLADLNYRLRFAKFGWDSQDGEITAYGDIWVMDGTVTQQQFGRMLGNFLPAIDMNYNRIRQTLETGKDPGEVEPGVLQRLIDKLRKKPSVETI